VRLKIPRLIPDVNGECPALPRSGVTERFPNWTQAGVSNCCSIPVRELVQAAEPFSEFWAKGTGASKIGNRSPTPFPDFFHAEPRRARRSEDWILSANSPSPRETSSALSPPRQKNSYQYLIEWKVAASTDTAANAFLGTQGDVWDTQEDMATALIGAVTGLALLSWFQNLELGLVDR
jgi:hypothetical protein